LQVTSRLHTIKIRRWSSRTFPYGYLVATLDS